MLGIRDGFGTVGLAASRSRSTARRARSRPATTYWIQLSTVLARRDISTRAERAERAASLIRSAPEASRGQQAT